MVGRRRTRAVTFVDGENSNGESSLGMRREHFLGSERVRSTSTWNHKLVLPPIPRDGHGACHRARIRATRWWPLQGEVSPVESPQPHAEERATRASRSMGSKRLTCLT
jgi:hypothetical protein